MPTDGLGEGLSLPAPCSVLPAQPLDLVGQARHLADGAGEVLAQVGVLLLHRREVGREARALGGPALAFGRELLLLGRQALVLGAQVVDLGLDLGEPRARHEDGVGGGVAHEGGRSGGGSYGCDPPMGCGWYVSPPSVGGGSGAGGVGAGRPWPGRRGMRSDVGASVRSIETEKRPGPEPETSTR